MRILRNLLSKRTGGGISSKPTLKHLYTLLIQGFCVLCLVGMACFFVSCGQDDLSGQEDGITRGGQTDSTTHITVLTDTTWAGTREYEY